MTTKGPFNLKQFYDSMTFIKKSRQGKNEDDDNED